jgi:hypothetical protein
MRATGAATIVVATSAHWRGYPTMKQSTIAHALSQLSGDHTRADLVCTQCARVAGTAEGSNARQAQSITIRVQDPAHAGAVRRLCCPHCSGRLWLQNSEDARDTWHALGGEALRPRYGRPSKLSPPRGDQEVSEASS